MKKLIFILSLFVLSCTKQDVQRNSILAQGTSFSASITKGEKILEAGSRYSLRITVNVSRADSATKIELARADFAYILDVPLKNGDNLISDYQVNQSASQTTYIVRSTLIDGETRFSVPVTINH